MKAPIVCERIPISKNKMKSFIKKLSDGNWSSYWEKNDRGDYGTDEHFFKDGVYSHTISIDGGHQDIRFYIGK